MEAVNTKPSSRSGAPLQARAKTLHLHGLLARWQEAVDDGWIADLPDWEEDERARRSLERRLGREIFPNAACVVSMVDRLMHNAEFIAIEGGSYRVKEARECAEQRAKQRKATKEKPQAGGKEEPQS